MLMINIKYLFYDLVSFGIYSSYKNIQKMDEQYKKYENKEYKK